MLLSHTWILNLLFNYSYKKLTGKENNDMYELSIIVSLYLYSSSSLNINNGIV